MTEEEFTLYSKEKYDIQIEQSMDNLEYLADFDIDSIVSVYIENTGCGIDENYLLDVITFALKIKIDKSNRLKVLLEYPEIYKLLQTTFSE